MNSTNILDRYETSGLLARVALLKCAGFEASEEASERTSCMTYILHNIPIRLIAELDSSLTNIGFLYFPEMVNVRGAFKINIGSKNLDLSKPIPFEKIEGKKRVKCSGSTFRDYETIMGIAEKVTRMHNKNPNTPLYHNELLVTALEKGKDHKDRIAGVIVGDRMLNNSRCMLKLLAFMNKELPGRNIHLYHYDIGEISVISTKMAMGILIHLERIRLANNATVLRKLVSKL
ncbi:MAG: hypothetical protein P0S95_04450 [Rhabdochlamydiaceae bacterium]|nr:hypothetical protein [Candidatus Amphrikana amoebophyrae]